MAIQRSLVTNKRPTTPSSKPVFPSEVSCKYLRDLPLPPREGQWIAFPPGAVEDFFQDGALPTSMAEYEEINNFCVRARMGQAIAWLCVQCTEQAHELPRKDDPTRLQPAVGLRLSTLGRTAKSLTSEDVAFALSWLTTWLPQFPFFRTVDLSGNPLSKTDASALASLLRSNLPLDTLELQSCGLSTKSLELLGKGLLYNNELKKLNVADNSRAACLPQDFVNGLRNNQGLVSLDLRMTASTSKGVFSALSEHPALTELYISDMRIDKRAQAFLRSSPALRAITLERITTKDSDDFSQLLLGLASRKVLTYINFSGNTLKTSNDTTALRTLIERGSMQQLVLWSCKPANQMASVLGELDGLSKNLQRFYFAGNRLDGATESLCRLIRSSPALREIDFACSGMKGDDLRRILQAVQDGNCLTAIGLAGNDIDDATLSEFDDACHANRETVGKNLVAAAAVGLQYVLQKAGHQLPFELPQLIAQTALARDIATTRIFYRGLTKTLADLVGPPSSPSPYSRSLDPLETAVE